MNGEDNASPTLVDDEWANRLNALDEVGVTEDLKAALRKLEAFAAPLRRLSVRLAQESSDSFESQQAFWRIAGTALDALERLKSHLVEDFGIEDPESWARIPDHPYRFEFTPSPHHDLNGHIMRAVLDEEVVASLVFDIDVKMKAIYVVDLNIVPSSQATGVDAALVKEVAQRFPDYKVEEGYNVPISE